MSLAPELHRAIAALAQTPVLLVALDFDGTMSPLVDRAEDARPLPRSAAALSSLASLESTTTALVSGRALDSLRAVAAPPAPTLLVGSHGAEAWWGPDSPGLELTPEQQHALTRARAVVAQAVARFPGTVAEQKPAGVVLHFRLANSADARAAVVLVNEALAGAPEIHLSDGKMVREISVVRADKGQSLAALRSHSGATGTFFAGDDVTDEHAFAALGSGDLGVKVGPGETSASQRIATPQDLPEVLEALLAARRAHLEKSGSRRRP